MRMSHTQEILTLLERMYPDAAPALKFRSPYELLVAVILSAQCTDERVNKVTDVLFAQYNTPEKMLTLSQEELEKYIYSCGFYHQKDGERRLRGRLPRGCDRRGHARLPRR